MTPKLLPPVEVLSFSFSPGSKEVTRNGKTSLEPFRGKDQARAKLRRKDTGQEVELLVNGYQAANLRDLIGGGK